jgi:hypothetical protein
MDYYAILGIPTNATPKDIADAYTLSTDIERMQSLHTHSEMQPTTLTLTTNFRYMLRHLKF